MPTWFVFKILWFITDWSTIDCRFDWMIVFVACRKADIISIRIETYSSDSWSCRCVCRRCSDWCRCHSCSVQTSSSQVSEKWRKFFLNNYLFFSFVDHLRQFSSGLYNNNNNNNIALRASFRDNPDNPVSECKTVLDFAAARDDEGIGGDNRVTRPISCQLKSVASPEFCVRGH